MSAFSRFGVDAELAIIRTPYGPKQQQSSPEPIFLVLKMKKNKQKKPTRKTMALTKVSELAN